MCILQSSQRCVVDFGFLSRSTCSCRLHPHLGCISQAFSLGVPSVFFRVEGKDRITPSWWFSVVWQFCPNSCWWCHRDFNHVFCKWFACLFAISLLIISIVSFFFPWCPLKGLIRFLCWNVAFCCFFHSFVVTVFPTPPCGTEAAWRAGACRGAEAPRGEHGGLWKRGLAAKGVWVQHLRSVSWCLSWKCFV